MKESFEKTKIKIIRYLSFKKVNPHVHWRNLLYLFILAAFFLIIFSFYLMSQIKNQQIFQITSSTTTQPSLINEKLYNKVIESFKPHSLDLSSYQDPSIY